MLYSVHKIVSGTKLNLDTIVERYQIIKDYKSHLYILIGVYTVGTIYYAIKEIESFNWAFVLSLIVSILYVFPIFRDNKRLRDFNFLKIFLIAIVWVLVTFYIPVHNSGLSSVTLLVLSLERGMYIMAITLPFDMRDADHDKLIDTKTIPNSFGNYKSKILSFVLISCSASILAYYASFFILELSVLFAYFITYIFAILLILFTNTRKPDWYYVGIIDGTMLLPFIIYLIVT
jgi:4-hydroxybenzoate polyprenyltransferase